MRFHFCYFAHFCSFLCILTNPAPEIPLLLFINIRQFPCFETMGRFSLSPCEKECALAHSRAEARLLQQPSTTAPSAHLCKLCLLLWNREFYRNFLFHKKVAAQKNFLLYTDFFVRLNNSRYRKKYARQSQVRLRTDSWHKSGKRSCFPRWIRPRWPGGQRYSRIP